MGAPINEVRIPIGISAALILLAIVSTQTRKIEPSSPETGINFPWFAPQIPLAICGITRPTQPITPAIVTDAETRREATVKSRILNKFGLTPDNFACSSPRDKYLV